MSEKYIKLEDACNLMRQMCDGYDWLEVENDYAIQKLQELPAADVRPVVRGEWLIPNAGMTDRPMAECSNCGWYIVPALAEDFSYCPNCGADMREEDNG